MDRFAAACAAAAAAERLGMIDRGDISVKTRGGLLVVRLTPEGAWLTGDAVLEYRGEIEV